MAANLQVIFHSMTTLPSLPTLPELPVLSEMTWPALVEPTLFARLGELAPDWNMALGFGGAMAAALIAAAHWSRTLPEVPELRYQRTEKNERIVSNCTMLTEPYHPPIVWGWNGHAQTVVFGVMGRPQLPPLQPKRVLLPAPDGATVSLDYFSPENALPTTPVIVVCPGICNSSESAYIRGFAFAAMQMGYRMVVFNHHGALSDLPIKKARLFTFGGTEDLEQAVRWSMKEFTDAPIVGVGFSMGANLIIRLCGIHADIQQRLSSVISVCQGYYIISSAVHLAKNAFYDQNLTVGLKRIVKRHQEFFARERPDIDLNAVLNVNLIGEFDLLFTLPTHSHLYSSIDDYYSKNSSGPYLDKLFIPTLLINAADDPLVAPELLNVPRKAADINPNIVFLKTRHGGHLGFFEGTVFPKTISWMDRFLLDYIRSVLKST